MISKTLKILFLTAALIFYGAMFFNAAMAADVNKTITFAWNQDAADLPNLAEWRLHWGDVEAGPFVPVLDINGNAVVIPYDGTPAAEYTASQPFIITVPAGSSVTKYFVMTAVDTDGDESGYSNVALNADQTTGVVFKAPIGAPFTFEVQTIVTTP